MPFGVVVEPLQQFHWECFPAIVKPTNQHASIGITRASVVQDRRALWQQLEFVFDVFHAPALVEEFIAGRECTLTVLGNEELRCLPPLELDFGARNAESFPIYSYESKFISDAPQVTLRHPAPLENFIQRKMERVASAAFRALGCHDYARVDVRLRGDEVCVLDVNAYPALDAESAVSLCGRAAGREYGQLLDGLVTLAQARVKFH